MIIILVFSAITFAFVFYGMIYSTANAHGGDECETWEPNPQKPDAFYNLK